MERNAKFFKSKTYKKMDMYGKTERAVNLLKKA